MPINRSSSVSNSNVQPGSVTNTETRSAPSSSSAGTGADFQSAGAARASGQDRVGLKLKDAVESGLVLRRGANQAEVVELQKLLNRAGASPQLVADGDFGPGTERALKAFQKKHGLGTDGVFGRGSMKALWEAVGNDTPAPSENGNSQPSGGPGSSNSAAASTVQTALDGRFKFRRGARGSAVKALQELLNQAGASPQLVADGDYGRGSEKAVRDFQRKHGLLADGKFGPGTWAKLQTVLKLNDNSTNTDNNTNTDNSTRPNDGVGKAVETTLLSGGRIRKGDRGTAVRELQELLNRAGASPQLVVDGDYGSGTERAILQFQQRNGLSADGQFGPNTWSKLKSVLGVEFDVQIDTTGLVTLAQLRRIMPNLSVEKAQIMLPHLNTAMAEAGITTKKRKAAFLAQIAHESVELRYMEEIASGAAYEGRRDLGNTQPGDGRRFKGRGPIQLTGRANYTAAGRDLGLDLVGDPGQVATPEVGFRTTAWFWKKNGLNELADAGDFRGVTRRINGGYNGYNDRLKYYNRALGVL